MNWRLLLPVTSLLASMAILLLGHGLQLILLPLRADLLGWSATYIGYTGSSYFLGFVVGCITIPGLIARVGHIRTFTVMTANATTVLLLLALTESFLLWLLLRFTTGWALSGIYMVIESWLNEKAQLEYRGRILSIYTIIMLASFGSAQLLVGLAPPEAPTLFLLAGALMCVAIVPVGLTRVVVPQPVPSVRFRLGKLFHSSQVAAFGALFSGMVVGAFWALGPVYASLVGVPLAGIGIFMALAVFGGALSQFPVGRLSDRIDRRKVILALCILGVLASLALIVPALRQPQALPVFIFLFGAAAMPLYSICVAHANDNAGDADLVEVATGVLMMNSIGCVIGPALTAPLMTAIGPASLFGVAAAVYTIAAGWTLVRIRRRPALREHYQPYAYVTETTQAAIELYPHGAAEADEAVAQAEEEAEAAG